MHDGREVANFILDVAEESKLSLTNISLQKIMYFCHVWFLVSTGKPLIRHSFEAWEYGPVLPYIYRYFSNFEDKKLTSRITKIDMSTGNKIKASINVSDQEKSLIRNIINFYSQLSARQLVELSHTPGGPWDNVWNYKEKINPGMKISNEEILEFYSSEQRPHILQ